MSLWGWYRSRRIWVKGLIGLPAGLVALVLLYVLGRSIQFMVSEKEAGLYLPATANVVVRAKDLEHHLDRLLSTPAWRVIQRRVLKDPALRPLLNGILKDQGAPTLDALEDERNRDVYSVDLLLRGAGRDAVAALQVGDSWGRLRWFACTRLRWSDYLAAPLGRLVLPSELVDGVRVLRLRQGGADFFVALEGRLALVSNDRTLLQQALRRQGAESPGDHPVTLRAEFGPSRALLELRRTLQEAGALSQIKWDTVRAVEVTPDLEGSAARLEVTLEGADPARPEAGAPHDLLRLAPAGATGAAVSSTGIQELLASLRSTLASRRGDPVAKNIGEALRELDGAGFSTEFVARLDGGMAVVTGVVEGAQDNRSYPALAILVSSRDPQGAVEALSAVIRTLGGRMAEARFEAHLIGDVKMWSFEWPRGMPVNDFLRPCFAAVPGAFVFGNNFRFTESILRGVGAEGGFEGIPGKKLREHGIVERPSLAGGHLFFPALRESLDGPLPQVARFVVDAALNRPQLRAQLEAELRQQGRTLPGPQVDELFYERIRNQERDKEDELRASLHALDFMKWGAFSLQPGGRGAQLRAAIEFK